MLKIEERHLKIVNSILSKYPYQFYAFGSRVKGNAKTFSDLDLCCKDEMTWVDLAHLNEEFEESSLPFRVDLVSWNRIDHNFRTWIEKDFFLIKKD
jgi:predicted nucleotidyltransferase